MKKRIILSIAVVLIPLVLPYFAFAANSGIQSNVFNPTILNGPLLICVGSQLAGGAISQTCQNLCDLVAQIANIIYYMIAVVLWIIAPIMVATGGIFIMLGGANPEMISRGKRIITDMVWAIVIVLCAWLIVFSFVGAFGNLSQYVGGFGGANGQAACSLSGGSGNSGSSNILKS